MILHYRRTADTGAVAILFQRYTPLVYGVCLKYLADPEDARDAVMEIFEGLMDSLLIHEVENFKGWLYTVTRNHCLIKLRKVDPLLFKDVEKEEISSEDFMENPVLEHLEDGPEKFRRQDLQEALGGLRESQRKCLELFYLQGKTYQEIAGQTGYSFNEVKSHIQNGKRNMKIILEKKHEN